ncbi:GNAT family N-acetyltransferase [Sphingobacterium psychroaquaticum]|uniref:Putative acetyltransferase n=1 Tax=Sphingobacterium psychroaquaticum TaxID=561061 RepID=A0A1X7KSK7_9SPHI|nr:GNAT family N-acetyltransferase [Sphingobacterium psychroaquaticum]SMG43849.1 putative acetyltransferase [Sphingobacterium psychroaquaticum]
MIIRPATPSDYSVIMEIWRSAVLATHHFLSHEDFKLFERLIPTDFLPQLEVYIMEEANAAKAFFSVSEDNLEMLFVSPTESGKGFGKAAVQFVVHTLGVTKVDVNEQNEQAVGFYLKQGYKQIARSEKDGMGKPYPLLHLLYPTE